MPSPATTFQPMTVGEILERSFGHLKRALPDLAIPLAALAILSTGISASSNDAGLGLFGVLLAGVGGFLYLVASIIYFFAIIFYVSDIWTGKKPNLLECARRVDFKLFLKMAGLVIKVTFITIAGLVLFIVPGLVYALNRCLAYPILLLEGSTVQDSINRSKFLMTHYPQGRWYSWGSPWTRISGLLLIGFILNMIVGAVVGVSALFVFGSMAPIKHALNLVGSALYLVTGLYSHFCLIGFYYDLRMRSEGTNLIQA